MLHNKGVKGTESVNIWKHIAWKREIFWKAILNKFCLNWCSLQYALFIFSKNDPRRELRRPPIKCTFLINSKTVKNLWTLVEQKLFEISRPFFRYQVKGACPLIKGCEGVWRLIKISFYLFQSIQAKVLILTILV